ncbi:LOW QUALITY PROTEIN: high-affinity choline transporter 1-like [Xyrichtys novacula]|nr:LOW QUALITY PROTEIN: high-affinity choline transporter 1-like [Xyrichtys novacula]
MVFPIILLHLTPTAVFVIGMGAIAGAAMSSTDSYLLAASSIFTTNIYKLIRPQASDRELQWVIRSSIVIIGIVGTSFTYLDSSILVFWILSSDLTYTIMLPQLICILFIRVSNPYGAVIGYIIAFVLRALCGEPVLNLPAILHFPGCTLEDGVYIQRSPFKTICMLVSLVSIVGFSYLASILFEKEILPERWDVFKVKSNGASAEGARELRDGEKAKNENKLMLDTKC